MSKKQSRRVPSFACPKSYKRRLVPPTESQYKFENDEMFSANGEEEDYWKGEQSQDQSELGRGVGRLRQDVENDDEDIISENYSDTSEESSRVFSENSNCSNGSDDISTNHESLSEISQRNLRNEDQISLQLYGDSFDALNMVMELVNSNAEGPNNNDDYTMEPFQSVQDKVRIREELKSAFDRNYTNHKIRKEVFDILGIKDSVKSNGFAGQRVLSIDVCPEGCTAYIGERQNLRQCPSCTKYRFKPCSNRACRERTQEQCMHANSTRTPERTMQYRPIIATIKSLLETRMFPWILDWNMHLPNQQDEKFQNIDFMQGDLAKLHMREMTGKFNERLFPEGEENIMINLLFARGYDGAQVYKTRTSVFWPYFLQLMNVPPPLRGDIGIGFFLTALFTGPTNSEVESFFMERFLLQEFQQLNRGILIENSCGKRYFVQARLILHKLDLKALEKEFRIQCSTAAAPCPFCGLITGVRDNDLRQTTFTGHRCLLPLDSLVRRKGLSQHCCPFGFHEYREDIVAEHMNRTIEMRGKRNPRNDSEAAEFILPERIELTTAYQEIIRIQKLAPPQNPRIADPNTIMSCTNFDEEYISQIRSFCKQPWESNGSTYSWFHTTPYDWEVFTNNLHFEHCDFRKERSLKRINTDEYVRLGMQAEQEGKAVRGIRGVCCYAKLPYFRFDKDVQFDGYHTIVDTIMDDINIQKGIRAVGERIVSHATRTKLHFPYLHSKESASTPPWIVSTNVQRRCDAAINAALIPLGHCDRWQIKCPYQCSGLLRGAAKLRLCLAATHFMNMIQEQGLSVLGSNLEEGKPYRTLRGMFSKDLVMLLNPILPNSKIPDLFNLISETVSLREGLYPKSESKMIQHAMIHLAHPRVDIGPLEGNWTFDCERAIKEVKSHLRMGGISSHVTTVRSYNQMEVTKTNDFYNFDLVSYFHGQSGNVSSWISSKLSKNLFRIVDGKLTYDPFNVRLYQSLHLYKVDKALTKYEFSRLLKMMTSVVLRHYNGNEDRCLESSSFYRLQYAYNNLKRKRLIRIVDICAWFNFLQQYKQSGWIDSSDIGANSSFFGSFESTRGNSLVDWLKQGNVMISDLDIISSICNPTALYYRKAIIFGVRFTGRGWRARETEEPVVLNPSFGRQRTHLKYGYHKSCNKLQNHLKKKDFSSWIKFNNFELNTFVYGLVNGFSRLCVPGDEVLNGLPYASVTTFEHTNEVMVDKIFVEQNVGGGGPLFVPLMNFVATAIAVVPFCKSPHLRRGGLGHDAEEFLPFNIKGYGITSENSKFTVTQRTNALTNYSHLYMLEMYPEKAHLQHEKGNFKQYNDARWDT